jgi:hypothetical protein
MLVGRFEVVQIELALDKRNDPRMASLKFIDLGIVLV